MHPVPGAPARALLHLPPAARLVEVHKCTVRTMARGKTAPSVRAMRRRWRKVRVVWLALPSFCFFFLMPSFSISKKRQKNDLFRTAKPPTRNVKASCDGTLFVTCNCRHKEMTKKESRNRAFAREEGQLPPFFLLWWRYLFFFFFFSSSLLSSSLSSSSSSNPLMCSLSLPLFLKQTGLLLLPRPPVSMQTRLERKCGGKFKNGGRDPSGCCGGTMLSGSFFLFFFRSRRFLARHLASPLVGALVPFSSFFSSFFFLSLSLSKFLSSTLLRALSTTRPKTTKQTPTNK